MGNQVTFLYGLEHSNHDFTHPNSLGKNTFTNAFPISIGQYLAQAKNLPIPLITAVVKDGKINTVHKSQPWSDIIGTDPSKANFYFETIYEGFKAYTRQEPNKSDIVVADSQGNHKRPFEVKLVVVPNSATADKPRNEQSCEIVVRPPTIEQLAFSIAHSYGLQRKHELLDIIAQALENPMDYQWTDEKWMLPKLPKIQEALNNIVKLGIDMQTPFALTAVWRTEGQKPSLEEHAFELFAWTDMAFVQLFTIKSGRSSKKISRPDRSMIWLVSALYDYAAQATLNFSKHHSRITYGAQTDKAGAFAGDVPYAFLNSTEFQQPRILRDEIEKILTPEAFEHLLPERRLDGALAIQHLINSQRTT